MYVGFKKKKNLFGKKGRERKGVLGQDEPMPRGAWAPFKGRMVSGGTYPVACCFIVYGEYVLTITHIGWVLVVYFFLFLAVSIFFVFLCRLFFRFKELLNSVVATLCKLHCVFCFVFVWFLA